MTTGTIIKRLFLAAFIGSLFFCPAIAAIRLPAIIGDNMVLQSGIKVPLWGWAASAEKISVEFKGKTYHTTANADGKWSLKLDVYQPGGPFELTLQSAESKILLKNILIGEVWLASGQSNMEFGIQSEKTGMEEIPKATDQQIRMFYVPMASSLELQPDILPVPANSRNGKWIVCSLEAMADPKFAWNGFSAAGYYFAKEIRRSTGRAVGMIASYKGGTPAQAWISLPGLQQAPAFPNYVNRHQALVTNYEQAKKDFPAKDAAYQEVLKKWNVEKTGTRPNGPERPDGGFGAPANLFNAMIAPLVPYGMKGVIWYQGEGNGDRFPDAIEYATLFPRLIADWRKQWGQGDFTFLFVQLTNFRKPATLPAEGIWPWVREAQLKTLALPKTGMAVITDIGDAADIHPKNKKDVGLRLALAARKVAYEEKLVYAGPMYRSMKIAGNTIRITFDHTGSGLTAANPFTQPAPAGATNLQGFGIAGADGKFVWADARLEKNTVMVSSPQVPAPVAVRYNWADNPPGTLYNREGLPAAPFRTDNFTPKP